MTGRPDEEQWGETERILRRLLESAVPTLTAPVDRMAGIRRKAERRRRRRVVTATAVTALAALAVLLPRPPAGSDSHTEAPMASSSPTVLRGPRGRVSLLGPQHALHVTLPRDWYALSVDDARGGAVAFLATQPLVRPAHGDCVNAVDTLYGCRPLNRLNDGGALIVLRHTNAQASASANAADRLPSAGSSVGGCERVGAKGESSLRRANASGSAAPVVLLITVCRNNRAGQQTDAAIAEILASLSSMDGG